MTSDRIAKEDFVTAAVSALSGTYQPLDSDLTAIAALTTTSFGRALLALADAAAGRTALGLGTASTSASTDFQPIDSDLTAIAALTTTSFGRAVLALADAAALRTAAALGGAATLNVGTGTGTVMAGDDARWQPVDSDLTAIAALTTTSYGRAFLALADAAAARTALSLGTAALSATGDFQPVDSDLTAIAALTTTSYGRAFLALADAAAGRTALGLGTASTSASTDFQPVDTDLTTIAGLTATTDSFLQAKASAWAARTVAQVKTDLAVSNVDNTSDANKPVSTAQQTALDGKQTLDSDLTTLAGLTATTDNIIQSVGSAWASRTPAQVKTALGLTVGTDVQAQDADLATIAGLTATTDSFLQSKSSAWAARTIAQVKADLGIPQTTLLGTDTVWAAKGDLIVGTANDTAAVVSIGTANQLLGVTSGTAAWVSQDGWISDANTWTRTGGLTFTVAVDATSWLTPGTKISVSDTTTKYGVIASSVFSAGTTTVTLITTSDAAGTLVSTLTVPRYSYAEAPAGFPSAFNWTPTLVGWSADPGNQVNRWFTVGRKITLIIAHGSNGTSNATNHTATLPVTAVTVTNATWGNPCRAVDNGTTQVGQVDVVSAGTVATLRGILAGTNTGSGNGRIVNVMVTYEF